MFVNFKLKQHFATVSQSECNERVMLPPLRFANRNKLIKLVNKVNYLFIIIIITRPGEHTTKYNYKGGNYNSVC